MTNNKRHGRQVPCKFYAKGNCNRGDQCRFMHQKQEMPVQTTSTPLPSSSQQVLNAVQSSIPMGKFDTLILQLYAMPLPVQCDASMLHQLFMAHAADLEDVRTAHSMEMQYLRNAHAMEVDPYERARAKEVECLRNKYRDQFFDMKVQVDRLLYERADFRAHLLLEEAGKKIRSYHLVKENECKISNSAWSSTAGILLHLQNCTLLDANLHKTFKSIYDDSRKVARRLPYSETIQNLQQLPAEWLSDLSTILHKHLRTLDGYSEVPLCANLVKRRFLAAMCVVLNHTTRFRTEDGKLFDVDKEIASPEISARP